MMHPQNHPSAPQPRQILGLRPEPTVSEECFCLNSSCGKISTICLGNYEIFYVYVPVILSLHYLYLPSTSLILTVRE